MNKWVTVIALAAYAAMISVHNSLNDYFICSLQAGLFYLVASGNSFFGLLTFRPMMLLGRISYSIYLLHGIVLLFAYRLLDSSKLMSWEVFSLQYWSAVGVLCVLIVSLAALSYRYLECPFENKDRSKVKAIEGQTKGPEISRLAA